MRTLVDHIVPGDSVNHQVEIAVGDDPGAGGAHHVYWINWKAHREVGTAKGGYTLPQTCLIPFQNGPIKEFGVNGITQEALLAIIIDRLRCFQAGPFACEDNAVALAQCQSALHTLQNRTRTRMARGVEGTNEK